MENVQNAEKPVKGVKSNRYEKAENKEKKSNNQRQSGNNKSRKNFRYKKNLTDNKNTPAENIATTDKKVKVAKIQKPVKDNKPQKKFNDINSAKDVKKSRDKKEVVENDITDFVLGEFSDNDKNYAFKMSNHKYLIVEYVNEQENILLTTKESRSAYTEWCKIKYPEKVKKGIV